MPRPRLYMCITPTGALKPSLEAVVIVPILLMRKLRFKARCSQILNFGKMSLGLVEQVEIHKAMSYFSCCPDSWAALMASHGALGAITLKTVMGIFQG